MGKFRDYLKEIEVNEARLKNDGRSYDVQGKPEWEVTLDGKRYFVTDNDARMASKLKTAKYRKDSTGKVQVLTLFAGGKLKTLDIEEFIQKF